MKQKNIENAMVISGIITLLSASSMFLAMAYDILTHRNF